MLVFNQISTIVYSYIAILQNTHNYEYTVIIRWMARLVDGWFIEWLKVKVQDGDLAAYIFHILVAWGLQHIISQGGQVPALFILAIHMQLLKYAKKVVV